ncbi:MAG: UDP-N-acetylmuramoylalanyl-D-glutamyl-2,6-diaminopimelate/D-alanyl-D-alanyl ligase [Symbiobacteriaceae bacterium]|nr:UDP-N-acetylmuramoylalanyl-D-glutamyl-2,6-diaminopimelate/D-alanyl-D-alanyl ligase [Symbiobacteriaceae bacterium]
MKQLFTVAEILAVTGGRLLQGSPAAPVYGFAYDSRKVRPGDCFVAMPGERVDGHDYAARAAEAGATCILVGRSVAARGTALVEVKDPLLALGQLGRYHRERFEVKVVGVTGSVGKTTTKELIGAVLEQRFRVFRSKGNFNSEVGLPITLMDLDEGPEVAVLEMGMRALGEIEYLVSIARPSIGVVTNVGITHLELLGTQENIARAKGELVLGLPAGGAAVLNADDPWVAAMSDTSPCNVWFYGLEGAEGKGERWVTARDVRREGETGQRFTLVTSAGLTEAVLPAPGRHNVLNACAAAAVGLELGMTLDQVAAGIAGYAPSGSRMRILQAGGVRLLDDTYNAAPSSTIAALGVMRELAGSEGRTVAVLADMFELGAAAVEGHLQVGAEAGRLADVVITVGDLARHIAEAAGSKARHFAEKGSAIDLLQQVVQPGDTVLVKGSRGMAMEEIVAALEKHLTA